MDIKKAAESTLEIMNKPYWPEEKRDRDEPDSYYYVEWMLRGIIDGYIQHEKAHRWLGWAQAIILVQQGVDLDQLKLINKRA